MGCSFTNLHSIATRALVAVRRHTRQEVQRMSQQRQHRPQRALRARRTCPARLITSEAPSVPQTRPYCSAAKGVCFAPSARISSASPGTSPLAHRKRRLPESCPAARSPVPPVVRISSLHFACRSTYCRGNLGATRPAPAPPAQLTPASAKIVLQRTVRPERFHLRPRRAPIAHRNHRCRPPIEPFRHPRSIARTASAAGLKMRK